MGRRRHPTRPRRARRRISRLVDRQLLVAIIGSAIGGTIATVVGGLILHALGVL